MNIGIIGLGLMGGSLAKAVKRYGISKKVYGFTNSEKNKKEIEELGLVDELVDEHVQDQQGQCCQRVAWNEQEQVDTSYAVAHDSHSVLEVRQEGPHQGRACNVT